MEKKISVNAGFHGRESCPVSVLVGEKIKSAVLYDGKGKKLPCQLEAQDGGTLVSFVVGKLGAGESASFTLRTGETAEFPSTELVEKANKIDVKLSGKHFTTYTYGGDNFARPYLWPVVTPKGAKVTRSYPMVEGIAGETSDHRHHRSIWVAYGEVNDVDNWSEGEGHGCTVHRELLSKEAGPVYCKIATRNDWVSSEGKKVLEEWSSFKFYNTAQGGYLCDVEVKLAATEGDVFFGDTKEGGIISVRMATSIDVPRGGTIVNSFGGINEGETWGKKAHWCDYYGPTEGMVAGIAVMDHPGNLRHPTNWHVRNYGLMTANCFGLSHFYGDKSIRGDYTLGSSKELVFKYRLYVHDGTTAEAAVAQKYHDFINPPKVAVE